MYTIGTCSQGTSEFHIVPEVVVILSILNPYSADCLYSQNNVVLLKMYLFDSFKQESSNEY